MVTGNYPNKKNIANSLTMPLNSRKKSQAMTVEQTCLFYLLLQLFQLISIHILMAIKPKNPV